MAMTRAVTREGQANATRLIVSLSDAALLCGMVILWGLSWPVMKLSVEHAPPLWLAVLRFSTSSICLFVFGLFRREIRLPTNRDLPIIASIGLLQMAAFTALGMVAMTFIDAGKASLLAYSTPLWSVLIAYLMFRERPTRVQFVAVAVGVGGIAVMSSPLSIDWSNAGSPIAAGLLVIAAICWSVVILHVRRHTWSATPLQLAPWEMALASIILVPIAWAIDGPPTTIDWTPELVLLVLYFGPVATSFCFVVSAEVGRRISVFAMSNLTLGVPIIGTAASISFLGERLSLTSLSGFVLIVSGIAIAVCAVRRKAQTEDRTRERNNRQQQFFPTDRV
ncbi:EamA family transporter (plasmid) [Rhizobium sp. NIBRBAC000502774]|nr:EamA family transporter [Rhizobium sp. NIBRBAC000502774]